MTKKFKPANDRQSGSVKSHREDPAPPSNKVTVIKKSDREIRLNKFIANAGICSRREADQLIEKGEIKVNGKVETSLGLKVTLKDEVIYKGKTISAERKVYVLLNKPKGFVTTMDDPHAKKKVITLVQKACEERIYPVGRLDKDTTGLLLFTNDGELTKKLTHPSYEKKKVYHVFLDKEFTASDLEQVKNGLELEDGPIAADEISFVDEQDKSQVGIEIHSGKNRIVRRIFAHLGYKVAKLDRVIFAGLTKKNLPRGKWRFLTEKEVGFLKMN
ncbi:MAG TPA: pseudouridine synthase [Sunxiuqinia sp.]|nr:pseudouridine synthase [Sunxiuqinia sp.]